MRLCEVAGAEVYRTFGVPLKQVWTTSVSGLHDPNYNNGYGGIWVGLTPEYPARYGKDLGTTPTLMVPVLCTFSVDPAIKSRPPKKHPGDDDEIPGETMKLDQTELGAIISARMLVAGAWIPYDPSKLRQVLTDGRILDSLLRTQEIESDGCPDPNCATNLSTISSVDDLDGLCSNCTEKFGLTGII